MPEKWSARTNPRRFVITLVVVTAVCVLAGLLFAVVANRADAAPAQEPSARCVMDDGSNCPTVTTKHKKTARKFRHNKIHHADGFAPSKVFRKPKVAKRVIVRKIVRAINRTDKPLARDPGCTDRCLAYKMYGDLVANATCVDKGDPYPLTAGTCKYPSTTHKLTKGEIQATGAVILCGGAVALGVATSGATAGTTAFVAAWGAAACGWSFWSALDPG